MQFDSGRVLVVAPQPFYEDRGTPIAVRQLLEALSELGCEVDLVTYPVGRSVDIGGVRTFRAANPLRIRSVPIGLSARKLLLDASLVVTLARLIRRERYAMVHALEEAAFPAVVLGRLAGVPVVYDMQSSLVEQLARLPVLGGAPAQALLRALERWLLRRADVVVTSAGLAERVRRAQPLAQVREWRYCSEHGAPAPDEVRALRASLGIPPDARVVLYSGTFESYQGLPGLLDAVPSVVARAPRTVFLLVGADGERGGVMEARCRALGLNGAMRVLPRQPRERMPAFLALADVLVSPRAYGGNLPLKIFDYLAAGRPIVATDIPTHRVVLDADRALLVPPDAAALADGIVSVLTDRGLAERLAAAGRAYAEQHLGWMEFVRSVDELRGAAVRARGRS